jgi:hypothetical protein
VVLCLALPGALLWRMLAGRQPRAFVQDVVFGTSLAYAVELGVYAVARAAGLPRAVALWPLLVLAASLVPRLRGRAWRPEVLRMPTSWGWAMAGLVVFTFTWVARHQWWPNPLTSAWLRHPYVDEPYQLALVAALRRDLPADLPFIDGEPLQYHWFVHADLAAASWTSGIEPLVLLQRLGPAPMIVIVLMGASLIAGQLAQSRLAAIAAPALITVLGTAQLPPSLSAVFVTDTLYLSPTTTFAQALLVGAAAASLALIRSPLARETSASTSRPAAAVAGGRDVVHSRLWFPAVMSLVALSGAKGTALPVLAGGYASVLLFTALLERRLQRAAATLLGVTLVVLLLAQRFVYGSSAHGLAWEPFAVGRALVRYAVDIPSDTAASTGVVAALTMIYLVAQLSFASGIAGLVLTPAWRTPGAQFLVGASAAAVGATFTLNSPHLNQLYFLRTVPLLLAVSSAWGLALLVGRAGRGAAVYAVGAGILGGAVTALLVRALWPQRFPVGTGPGDLLLPLLVTAAVVLAVGVALVVLGRRRPAGRWLAAPVAVAMVLGLGAPHAVDLGVEMLQQPKPAAPVLPPSAEATIGSGGVEAARWLRARSRPHDVVATNAHCRVGHVRWRFCDARMFWLAGHSERQVLVEGWAYSPRTAERAELLDGPQCCLPFWDEERIEDNDAAFERPSREVVTRLREKYGVSWLVLDRRVRGTADTLAPWAEPVFDRGDYEVYRMR